MGMKEFGEGGSRWVLWRMDDPLFFQFGRHLRKCIFPFPLSAAEYIGDVQTNRQGAVTMLPMYLCIIKRSEMLAAPFLFVQLEREETEICFLQGGGKILFFSVYCTVRTYLLTPVYNIFTRNCATRLRKKQCCGSGNRPIGIILSDPDLYLFQPNVNLTIRYLFKISINYPKY
jgi:hypothetical protein